MATATQVNGNWQVETGSITNADLAHSTIGVIAGTGLSGGGTPSLGSSTTLTANVTNGTNTFTAVQTITVNSIGSNNVTGADGLIIQNTTAATSGSQVQNSPDLHFVGYAWNTVGSLSQKQEFAWQIVASYPVPSLVLFSQIASGGWGECIAIDSNGNLTVLGNLTVDGEFLIGGNPVRTPAPSTLNIYVNGSTGSDSNNGLSTGTAFLTIQAAINLAASYDTGSASNSININVAAGTYSASNTLPTIVGAATIFISGVGSGSVTCTSTSGNVFSATSILGTWALSGMTLTTSGTGIGTVYCSGFGSCIQILSDINFGVASGKNHLFATNGGQIQLGASYTISGGSTSHLNASNLGTIVSTATITVTVSASISITTFAQAVRMGFIYTGGITYSLGGHTVTGTRYSANTTGLIDTLGSSATYFPGTISGSTATQGLYA